MILLPCPLPIHLWPEYARRYGLDAVKTMVEAEDGFLRLTLFVECSEGDGFWCMQGENEDIGKEMALLKKILKEMHEQAAARPGQPVRRELRGGLRVDVMIAPQVEETRLQLSREHAFPSATEFAVVMNHWPYELSLDIEPERKIHGLRYFLCCAWKTPDVCAQT